jgi:succinoglycan biosynthesis transport protein ExoP
MTTSMVPVPERRPDSRTGVQQVINYAPVSIPAESDVYSEYFAALARGKYVIVSSAVICALAAFAMARMQDPVYRASASIEIQDFNDNLLSASESDARVPRSDDSYFQTQVETLSSNSLLQRVSNRLHLAERFSEPTRTQFDAIREFLGIPRHQATPREQALDLLKNNLGVIAPRGASRIVRLEYEAGDPQFAANVANTIGEEFIDMNLDQRSKAMQRNTEFLAHQVQDLRGKLENSEMALQSYVKSAGLLFTADKDSVDETKLKQLQDELSKAQADRMAKQSKYEMVATGSSEAVSELLDSGPLRDYQVKLTDARQQLAQLRSLYTPNHFKVKQAEAQVGELEAAIAGERKNILTRLEGEYRSAKRREDLVSAAYAAHVRVVTDEDSKTAKYNILKREVETNRQIYDTVLQKIKTLNVTAAMRARNIMLVDVADPPTSPVKPRTLLSALVGLLTGLAMGGAFIYIRENTNRTLRAPGEVTSYLNVPELGVIPSGLPRGLNESSVDPSMSLVALSDTASPIADSFRAAVASILFSASGQKHNHNQVIMITSPSPKEGKTTIAANIAIVLARIGKKVLVVDGDLRRPRLAHLLQANADIGLLTILNSDKPIAEFPLETVVQPTSVQRLSVLASGSIEGDPSDLLPGPRLGELFSRLRQDYEVVIVDSAPVLQVSDGRVLGRHADAAIVVCRASSTERKAAQLAAYTLTLDGTHVLGTILNDVKPDRVPYYRKYSYYAKTNE